MKKKGAIKAKKDKICLVNIGKSALERMQRKIVIRLKEEMQPSADVHSHLLPFTRWTFLNKIPSYAQAGQPGERPIHYRLKVSSTLFP